MRSLLLIALGFAILAVALTAEPKNETRGVDKPEPAPENNPVPTADEPAPKPARKAKQNEATNRRNRRRSQRRARSGRSSALGAASQGAKGAGKPTDFANDTVGNASDSVKTTVPSADVIPTAKDVKKESPVTVDGRTGLPYGAVAESVAQAISRHGDLRARSMMLHRYLG